MIKVDILRTIEQVESLEGAWERLFQRAPRQPSLSFEWSRAILRNHLAASNEWFVVVLKRGDDTVGIVPMMCVRERVLGFPITTLQPIQELYRTHGELLIDVGDVAALNAWFGALGAGARRWDLLRISGLLDEEALAESLSLGAVAQRFRVRIRVEQPAFHLRLPATYSEYLAERSAKFRSHLKRAVKRLEERGRVTFTRLRDRERFAVEFGELLEIERRSWKHAHGTAISAVAHQAGFYEALARDALGRGRLHLTLLRIDGQAVAYNLGLLSNDCYFYLKTSFVEELKPLGVATIGRARLIEQLIDDGVKAFDFSGEPYEWERQWTTHVRGHRSLLLFNRTMRGVLLWAAIGGLGLIRPRDRRGQIVFHDPRALRPPST